MTTTTTATTTATTAIATPVATWETKSGKARAAHNLVDLMAAPCAVRRLWASESEIRQWAAGRNVAALAAGLDAALSNGQARAHVISVVYAAHAAQIEAAETAAAIRALVALDHANIGAYSDRAIIQRALMACADIAAGNAFYVTKSGDTKEVKASALVKRYAELSVPFAQECARQDAKREAARLERETAKALTDTGLTEAIGFGAEIPADVMA